MKMLPYIFVAETSFKGRGVFTTMDIPSGSVIEICPLILIPANQTTLIDQTEIYNYYFVWDESYIAIALGYGSLYNHSDRPNAKVIYDFETNEIQIEAERDISANEEITINYTDGEPAAIWFKNLE